MSAFVLKFIALICMFFDHSKVIFDFLPDWFRYIGRISFIIFAYFIAEGSRYTRSLKKYLIRLIIFAFICEIPFDIVHFKEISLNSFIIQFLKFSNTIYTLAFGAATIFMFEKIKEVENNKWIFYPLLLAPAIMAEYAGCDYGSWGVLLIFIVYLCKERKIQYLAMVLMIAYKYRLVFSSFLLTDAVDIKRIMYFIWTLFPVFLISLYNGKRGKNFKWLFYIAYPLHFVILYTISLIWSA